jgi:hypothetical protein
MSIGVRFKGWGAVACGGNSSREKAPIIHMHAVIPISIRHNTHKPEGTYMEKSDSAGHIYAQREADTTGADCFALFFARIYFDGKWRSTKRKFTLWNTSDGPKN